MVAKIKKQALSLIDPVNRAVEPRLVVITYVVWTVIVFLTWYTSSSHVVPKPHEIVSAIAILFKNGFAVDLFASLIFTFKCMAIAVALAFCLAFLYLIPFMRPVIGILGKSRFLSTAGFTVLFALMTSNTAGQKQALLVFCIIVFQIVGFMDVVSSVPTKRLDYCFTIKLSPWRIVWEEMIMAKRSDMMVSIRQNFVIAWVSLPMVEGISRVDGGIGIVLEDLKRYFKYDQIFAVQLMVLLCGIGIDFLIEKIRTLAFNRWA